MDNIEKQLQDSFFNLSLDMLCVAGTDGYLKKVNRRWEEVLGYSASEICSKPMTEFIHPDDVDSTIQVRKNFDQGKDIIGFKNRYRCKDGSYRTLEWTAKREGQHVIGVARDITNRIQKERLATIGELAAGAGHEINNPLMIANGQVEKIFRKLQESNHLDSSYIEFFEKYNHATNRISKVISNLKKFAFNDRLNKQAFDVNSAINATVEVIREMFEKQQIKIIFNELNKPVFIKGQQTKLQQVIINLLMNSKEAFSEKESKSITLSLKQENQSIKIIFEDNGPGVPVDLEEKIFNLFFTTKLSQKASGMGLSLCQSLIRDYNGEINYVRKSKGACFEILLPIVDHESLVEDTSAVGSSPVQELTKNETKVRKILVVEDEPDLAEIVKECLESEDVKVDIAANGLIGIQALKKDKYDIIITDQSMPVMDGKTMIKNIYSEKLSSMGARIFLFTGAIDHIFSHADLQLECFKCCEIIPKPIGQTELRRRVLDEDKRVGSTKVN